MINQPRFLDESEGDASEPGSLSQPKTIGVQNARLQSPILMEHDPSGPDELSAPAQIEDLPETTVRISGFGFVSAMGLLLAAWFAIYAISFVVREYHIAHDLGYAAGLLVAITFALIVTISIREILSLRTLGEIGRLRAILASPLSSRQDVFVASSEWLSLISEGALNDDARKQIGTYETAEEIRGYLKSKISPQLDSLVQKYTMTSVFQISTMASISSKLFWEDITAILRSVILIRQIARVYGVRPSLSTTAALFKHIMITAAAAATAASMINSLSGSAGKAHPLFDELITKFGVGGTEVARIRQLASITAKSCNPLER